MLGDGPSFPMFCSTTSCKVVKSGSELQKRIEEAARLSQKEAEHVGKMGRALFAARHQRTSSKNSADQGNFISTAHCLSPLLLTLLSAWERLAFSKTAAKCMQCFVPFHLHLHSHSAFPSLTERSRTACQSYREAELPPPAADKLPLLESFHSAACLAQSKRFQLPLQPKRASPDRSTCFSFAKFIPAPPLAQEAEQEGAFITEFSH